jgi:hypothetical protein
MEKEKNALNQKEVLAQYEDFFVELIRHFRLEMLINDIPLKLQVAEDKESEDYKVNGKLAERFVRELQNRTKSLKKLDKELHKSYAKPALNLFCVLKRMLRNRREWMINQNLEIKC